MSTSFYDEFELPTNEDLHEDDEFEGLGEMGIEEEEFEGFQTPDPEDEDDARNESRNGGFTEPDPFDGLNLDDPMPQNVGQYLGHMMRTQTFLMRTMAKKSNRHKVYVPMPEKFTGKIGDYIDGWLEQFETWFRHREAVEGPLQDEEKVDTAIQNTNADISLLLSRERKEYDQWHTWNSFAEYMKREYGNKDPGYIKFLRLRKMTQQAESVDVYYARFHKLLSRQKRKLESPKDNFLYNYLFIEGLRKEISGGILALPAIDFVEDYPLSQVVKLAKRVERGLANGAIATAVERGTVERGTVETGKPAERDSQAGPIRGKKGHRTEGAGGATGGTGGDLSSRIGDKRPRRSDVELSEDEKAFLKRNIARGGGLVVPKETRYKSAWHQWARKENRCTICAATGHYRKQCKAMDEAAKQSAGSLNMMTSTGNVGSQLRSAIDSFEFYSTSDDDIARDIAHLCSMQERKSELMTYKCMINSCHGRAMTDTGASLNFISSSHAMRVGVKFLQKEDARDVLLPNGQIMKVLGVCEFEIQMTKWKGRIRATIVDIQVDFDVVLGLEWFRLYRPIPDWSTLDWYINMPDGALLIAHDSDVEVQQHNSILTSLQEIGGLSYECIPLNEAMKDLKAGGKGIFHFARSDRSQIQIPEGIPRLNSLQDLVENTSDRQIKEILREYEDIFREELPKTLPPKRKVDHFIDTSNEQPVNKNAYPLSKQQLEEQAKQVSHKRECLSMGCTCVVCGKEDARGVADVY